MGDNKQVEELPKTDLNNKQAQGRLRLASLTKRTYTESKCCITCGGEATRRVRVKLDRVLLQDDQEQPQQQQQEGGEREGENECVVNLHPCNIQVVMTVNAPVDFKLSLDDLPCFRVSPEKLPSKNEREDPYKQGWIAGSCNGLLLCTTSKHYQTEYYVSNTLTKQWVALPPAPRTHAYVHIGFIFDPCNIFNDDTRTHEPLHCNACKFKVVRIHVEYLCRHISPKYEVESFSSDTGQWTVASVIPPEAFQWTKGTFNYGSYFHNGCLHWLGAEGIVVYDPYKNELHGVIPNPKRSQCCQSFGMTGLALCRGAFWLCQISIFSGYLRLWELKGYDIDSGGNLNLDKCYWNAHRLCNFGEMTGGPKWASNSTSHQVIAMHPYDPDIIYLEMYWKAQNYVVCCNLRTKTLGRARFGYYRHSRVWGDILTLVLPARPSPVPSTSNSLSASPV